MSWIVWFFFRLFKWNAALFWRTHFLHINQRIPKFIHRISPSSYFLKDFIYLFLERGREGERGRETSVSGCPKCTLYWGPGPQPRHVPWLGIKPVTLWFAGWHSIHWATPARLKLFISFRLVIFKDFIYPFLERREGREKERETSVCHCLSCAPCWVYSLLNPLSYTSQGSSYFVKAFSDQLRLENALYCIPFLKVGINILKTLM